MILSKLEENKMSQILQPTEPISEELQTALVSTIFHHPMGGPVKLHEMGLPIETTPPPFPTPEQEEMTRDIVAQVL
jgi:hypothetical protein